MAYFLVNMLDRIKLRIQGLDKVQSPILAFPVVHGVSVLVSDAHFRIQCSRTSHSDVAVFLFRMLVFIYILFLSRSENLVEKTPAGTKIVKNAIAQPNAKTNAHTNNCAC